MDSASYYADYRSDNVMQELDDALDSCAKEVEVRSGLDRLNKVVSYLETSSYETAMKINSCQQEIFRTDGEEKMEKEKFLDAFLIREYLNNSRMTHDLCLNDLPNFINSASELASLIQTTASNEIVQKIQKVVEENAKNVVEKIDTLLERHAETLEKFNTEMTMRKDPASIFRKVLNVLIIGSLSAAFVCSVIMATAAAVPAVASILAANKVLKTIIAAGAVVQTFSPAIKKVHASLDKIIIDLNAQKDFKEPMKDGILEIIKELKTIRRQVENVNAMGEDASHGPLEKLKEFKEEIEKLKTATEKCAEVILNARKKVQKEYDELKSRYIVR